MLRVVYEATPDLDDGQTVDIHEARGRVLVKVREDADVEEYIQALNAELKTFLAGCGWFQLWRGRIISADYPGRPLTVQFAPDAKVDPRKGIEIRESCGLVKIHVSHRATADRLVRALNPALVKFLAGGQWFQLYEGEIVTMDSA
jgi:hypothetical protein